MAIKKIRVKNFKSFKELDVELGDLNILIGANASGKSNFIDIFRFLRDIRNSGLENAISLQGNAKYIRNVNIGSSGALSLEVISDREVGLSMRTGNKFIGIKTEKTIYKFAVAFEKTELGFKVAEDELILKCDFVRLEKIESGKIEKTEEFGLGKIICSNIDGKVSVRQELPAGVPDDILLPLFLEEKKIPPKTLLLEAVFPVPSIALLFLDRVFSDIPIYDFDPKFARRYAPISGKADLEENGNNLAIAINNIIESEDGKRKLMNLVTYLLDFVDDLDVERRSIDGSFLLKIRETYSEKFLPAHLISDGTINMIALIIALYFGKESLTIIEEPARGIHPYLISGVVDMMEDASESKQIIVTTHNPEMVRYANEKDLLLISRDYEGFSSISKPSDKEDLKTFLKNGLRVEDLYVDSLLETL